MREASEVFDRRVAAFERVLMNAVIPGDVEPWSRSVLAGIAGLEGVVAGNCARHDAALRDIVRQKPDLATHVDELARRDGELRETLAHLKSRLGRILDAGTDPDSSAEPLALVETMRERLLEWARKARLQEAEILAWFVEATLRDIGEVD